MRPYGIDISIVRNNQRDILSQYEIVTDFWAFLELFEVVIAGSRGV